MIEGPMDGSSDGSGDGMGKGARDGAADNTQDSPMDGTLTASIDTTHNKDADDKGDGDEQDKMTWNPRLVSFTWFFIV